MSVLYEKVCQTIGKVDTCTYVYRGYRVTREILLRKSQRDVTRHEYELPKWHIRLYRIGLTGAAVSIFMKYIAISAIALVHAVVKFVAELLAWRSMPASS